MSTPLVAGAMALWLEADPTLNVQDIRDIIASTSVKDEYTAKVDPVKVGAVSLTLMPDSKRCSADRRSSTLKPNP